MNSGHSEATSLLNLLFHCFLYKPKVTPLQLIFWKTRTRWAASVFGPHVPGRTRPFGTPPKYIQLHSPTMPTVSWGKIIDSHCLFTEDSSVRSPFTHRRSFPNDPFSAPALCPPFLFLLPTTHRHFQAASSPSRTPSKNKRRFNYYFQHGSLET